jgi:hypothetical protein
MRPLDIGNVAKVAPKDTGWAQYVKQRVRNAGSMIRLPKRRITACFPCHCAQNPYKLRHPWIPAGS